MKKYLGIIFILVLMSILLVNYSGNDKEIIKIGFIGPLSGEASPYGVPVKQGIELALKESIQKGYFKEGQIEIIYEDGKCDPKEAVGAANKLITIDKVKIILGGQCSGETMAIAPIAEENKIILLSSFSTSPDITNAGDYVFRVPPSDVKSAKMVADLMYKDGFRKVAILSEKTSAALAAFPIIKKTTEDLGSKVVVEEAFSSDNSDFYTIITKTISTNPDVVYLNVQTGATGSKLTKQLRDLGYKGQIYTYFITGNDFVKSGEWVNGVKILDFRAAKDKQILDGFLIKFKEMFNEEPSYPFGATLGYDTGSILFDALHKVGNDPEKIKNYFYSMEQKDSITGNLTFDQKGDPVGNDVYYLRQVVDNSLIDLQ